MKTFLTVLILTLVIFLLTNVQGCSALKPVAEDAVGAFAQGLGAALECKQTDLMEQDLKNFIFNRKATRGSVAEKACPVVVALGLSYGADQIPAKYECNPVMVKEKAGEVITDLCKKIPL